MAKKKKKKLKMKKKTFILLIAGICAVALIAEIVLMTMIFSKKKSGDDKPKERKYATETGLVVNPAGNAYRLLKYVEYGPTSAQLHEYSYDKYGRRTVETNYQTIRVESGQDPSESDLTLYVESEILYAYDKDDRMIRATVTKNKTKTVYTYEYDDAEGYLKNIYMETEDSEEGKILLKNFNERGLLVKVKSGGTVYKRYELDKDGHVIAELRDGRDGEVVVFVHELEYEFGNTGFDTLRKRTVKNKSVVEVGEFAGYSYYNDQVENYNADGTTQSISTVDLKNDIVRYTYNEKGQLLKESKFYADSYGFDTSSFKTGEHHFDYNDSGLPVEEYEETVGYYFNEKKTTSYVYGDNDRLLRKTYTVILPRDKKEQTTEWEYTYDDFGNPLKVVEIKGDAERVMERFEYVCADVPKNNLTQEDLRRMGKEYDVKTRMDPKDSVFDMPVYYSERRFGETYYYGGR